jgi:hypothetical protein
MHNHNRASARRAQGESVARREDSGSNMDPGFVQRVVQGVRYAVSGVGPESWFGPGQPIAPQAQAQAEGRAFDYPVGFNFRITPRGEELVSFGQLRALADSYDLMRLVIETRKDQIEGYDWEIVPKDKDDDAKKYAAAIKAATELFESPDKENDWPQWLRMLVEEMLVIDAMCVYPRATRGGQLYGFELVDGATIKRVLDNTGRTPLPPDPAYQQILKGIPAVDYTSDSLFYRVRNPRVWKIYGFSPVEQVITTVNIALRRQISQMSYYTEGNVPEALAQVPPEWTPKQVTEFQLNFDSMMDGNLAAKRKLKFIPALKQIDFPKKELLKDEYDEWLARIVCFAFSISPSALIKQVNRASGEQMADTAKEEGLIPVLTSISSFMTQLLVRAGYAGLKFRFKVVNKVAPLEQAKIDQAYVDLEVDTPDEIRIARGKEPLTPEEREKWWPDAPPPGMNPDGTPILPKGADGASASPAAPAPSPAPTKE